MGFSFRDSALGFLGRTPFVFVTFPFVLGILFSGLEQTFWGWLLSFGLLGLGSSWVFGRRLGLFVLGFLVLGFLSALRSVPLRECPLEYRTYYISSIETTPTLQGRYWRSEARILSYKDTLSGRWNALQNTLCQINIDTALRVEVGDVILYRSTLYPFDAPYSDYYLNRNVEGRSYVYRLDSLDRLTGFAYDLENLRTQLSLKIHQISPSDSSEVAMIQALTLGVRDNVSWQTRDEYRSSGASHLLAISGLHVGVIFGFLNLMLYWMRFWYRLRWVRFLIIVSLLWGYAFLSGMSASVIRAVVMFSVLQFGVLFHRRSLFNTLLISAFLMLIYNPCYLYDIGFQLSYLAMVGIFLIYSPLSHLLRVRNRFLRAIINLLLLSFSAQLITASLVLYTFGEISTVGLITNLGVWFTLPLIVMGGIIYLIFDWSWIGSLLIYITRAQNMLMSEISGWEFSTYQLNEMPLVALYSCYAVILLLILVLNIRKVQVDRK